MPSQSRHPDRTADLRNVGTTANSQNHQILGHSGDSQHRPAKGCIWVPACESNSSDEGSSIASTIQGQNSTPSSSLKKSHVADITNCMAFTPAATQQRSISTPTAIPSTSYHSPPVAGGCSQADSTRCVLSSSASGIPCTPTPLSSLENLAMPFPDPEAHATITNSLRPQATERYQRSR